MAKKKRSQPVVAKKKFELKIVLKEEDRPKVRTWGRRTQICSSRSDRERALAHGSRRHPKHKGWQND